MALFEARLRIDGNTTFQDLREFIRLTKNISGDMNAADYDERADLCGISAWIDTEDIIKE